MKRTWTIFGIALLGLWLSGIPAGHAQAVADASKPNPTQTIEQLRQTVAALEAETKSLKAQLASVRVEHAKCVKLVVSLKEDRSGGNPLADRRLRALLEECRKVGEKLDGLDEELRGAAARLEQARTALIAEIDGAVGQLSAALKRKEGDRRNLVLRMQQLVRLRQEVIANLPTDAPAPIAKRRDRYAELAKSSDPEELLQVADEMKDDEETLNHRIATLDGKIKQLARKARLLRKSEEIGRQESFYDEHDRVRRVVAKVDRSAAVRVERTVTSSDSTGKTGSAEPHGGSAGAPPPADDKANAACEDECASEPGTAEGVTDLDGDSYNAGYSSGDDGAAGSRTDVGPTHTTKTITTVVERIEYRLDLNPNLMEADLAKALRGASPAKQLKILRTLRQRLHRKASALGKRSRTLEKRAEQLKKQQ